MTEHTQEGGGTPLSFKKVPDPAHFERAPMPKQPVLDAGDPSLAFEAAPRVTLPRPVTPDPRTLKNSPQPPQTSLPAAPPIGAPPSGARPAFEAVPASLGVAQGRLSTPTIGIRPEPPPVAGPVSPGGSGWNIRGRDETLALNRGKAEEASAAWGTRPLPNAHRDRSAWDVPVAPRKRQLSGKGVLGIGLTVILVGILGFAGYEWLNSRAHPDHTITTPTAVGALTAIHTPATAAVTQQMQQVMQEDGATHVVSGVYGKAGRAMLVVLLAQGPNIESSTTQFFNDFTTGLKTQGVSVISGKTLNTTTDGSDFICSPATGPAPLTSISLCGWDDGDTIGLVLDVSGESVSATLREATAARAAGEH
ncbi:MAG: hypothetical protein ABSC35_11605 [Candidatus Dormibacteria bacterium]|jgi:hypothetical protein